MTRLVFGMIATALLFVAAGEATAQRAIFGAKLKEARNGELVVVCTGKSVEQDPTATFNSQLSVFDDTGATVAVLQAFSVGASNPEVIAEDAASRLVARFDVDAETVVAKLKYFEATPGVEYRCDIQINEVGVGGAVQGTATVKGL